MVDDGRLGVVKSATARARRAQQAHAIFGRSAPPSLSAADQLLENSLLFGEQFHHRLKPPGKELCLWFITTMRVLTI